MGALQDDRLDLRPVEFEDAEEVTRLRRKMNAELGEYMPPSPYELDFYARQGKPAPTD